METLIYVQSKNQLILVRGDSPIKAMLFTGQTDVKESCTLTVRLEGVHSSTIEGLTAIKVFLHEVREQDAKFIMTDEEANLWKVIKSL